MLLLFILCSATASAFPYWRYGQGFEDFRPASSDWTEQEGPPGRLLVGTPDSSLDSLRTSLEALSYCMWDDAKQVCAADTNLILKAIDVTPNSSDIAPFIPDIEAMLECASYGQNASECSANKFCEVVRSSGTCRLSTTAPATMHSAVSAAESTFRMCGWLGSLGIGTSCPAYDNLSDCAQAGCSVGHSYTKNSTASCVAGPVCADDQWAFAQRLCKGLPSWDPNRLFACSENIESYTVFVNCTRSVCPQLAEKYAFDMVYHLAAQNPCSTLTSRQDCLANPNCRIDSTGKCANDLSNKVHVFSPRDCPLADGLALTVRCLEAKTAESCVEYGSACEWEVLETCNSEGLAVRYESCVAAPETFGLYLRPQTSTAGSPRITPIIDHLSKAIVSAVRCPSFAVHQCPHADASKGSTDEATTDFAILEYTLLGGGLFLLCLAVLVLWCVVRKRRGAAARGSCPERPFEVMEAQLRSDSLEDSSSFKIQMDSSLDLGSHADPRSILGMGLLEHWFINADAIVLLDENFIGRGGFGEFLHGKMFGSTLVAIKRAYADHSHVVMNGALTNEIRLLRRIRHPNVVLFHGVTLLEAGSAPRLGIVLEWVSGGNLTHFVKRRHESGEFEKDCKATRQSRPSQIKEVKLLTDVARGLAYLHGQAPSILHRDVKPANILIEDHEPPLAKLADFGLSCLEDGSSKKRAGTRYYMAPEVLEQQQYSLPADIYSFGRVIFFINAGPVWQSAWLLPSSLLKLAEECVAVSPECRPVIGDAYSQLDCCIADEPHQVQSLHPNDREENGENEPEPELYGRLSEFMKTSL